MNRREWREKCGVFGIYGHQEAAKLTYLGLYALQHRGEESAGIVSSDGKTVRGHRGMGLVADVFNQARLDTLTGHLSVGHVRYSTTGSTLLKNTQPFLVQYARGYMAIAHNGNFVNALSLREELEKAGSIFQSTMDSELVIHLIARSRKQNREDAIVDALSRVCGAYSIVLMLENEFVAARDPHGFRPLCLGQIDGAYVVASESCALDLIQADYVREIEPGEIVFIGDYGIRTIRPFQQSKHALCIFEYIYFARPDSRIFGHNVYLTRKRLGVKLAQEHPAEADFVMPVPDSGNYAALGFAEKSQLPYEMTLVRNHYIGRTFIQPSQFVRDFGVKVKLNPVREVLADKSVLVIEDSIVRGTTSKMRMRTLREAGAKEIHMRVSCPPHRYPCFYGIDFHTRDELIAASHSVEEIAKYIGLDTLGYLSLEGMLEAMPLPAEEFCVACFTGEYPVAVEDKTGKYALERTS